MREYLAQALFNIIMEINKLSTTLILLVFLIVTLVIVLDSLHSYSVKKKTEAGYGNKSRMLGADGLKNHPTKTYVSDLQGLAGKPDAVIRENNYIIPVERKPLAKKIRDRYVAQLLVYMRLVEEFEGKKPPYGYLILGPKCKRVRIYNTPEKQAWLQNMLNEMRSILNGGKAKAYPDTYKCKKCPVNIHCSNSFTLQPKEVSNRSKLKIVH